MLFPWLSVIFVPMFYSFSTYQSHYKHLITLGVPVIIGQLGNIILSFADTLMIGQHSTYELAAASFVNSIFNLVIISAMGFTYGLTPLLGAAVGRNDRLQAGSLAKNSLAANTVVAFLLVMCMGVVYSVIELLGMPEELVPLMKSYFLILLASLPFVLWFNTYKQFSDGILDTRTPMWILLFGNLFNIIGNYLLIYGKLGLPELGLNGAGIATLVSRIAMAGIGFLLFFTRKSNREYRLGFLRGKINKVDFWDLNRIGWPVFLQMGMETASFSLSSIMVGWIGTVAMAAHQIMLTISQLCYLVFYGMSAAVAVRISHFRGQHDLLNLKRTASAGFHLNLFLILFTSFPVFLLRNVVGGLFTDSQEVALLVAHTILPLVVYQVGDGLQINYSSALRGIGDVKPMVWYAFLAYFVISLPMGYFLGIVCQLGLVGIWFAFPFGLTSAGILYYIRFRKSVAFLR